MCSILVKAEAYPNLPDYYSCLKQAGKKDFCTAAVLRDELMRTQK